MLPTFLHLCQKWQKRCHLIYVWPLTLECRIKVLPGMQHVGWHCHKTCLLGTQHAIILLVFAIQHAYYFSPFVKATLLFGQLLLLYSALNSIDNDD